MGRWGRKQKFISNNTLTALSHEIENFEMYKKIEHKYEEKPLMIVKTISSFLNPCVSF
jgi:hypothetical protein